MFSFYRAVFLNVNVGIFPGRKPLAHSDTASFYSTSVCAGLCEFFIRKWNVELGKGQRWLYISRRPYYAGDFNLKTHQMFSVHTTPDKFENAAITGQFGFVFEENAGKEITWSSWRHCFRNVFPPHENEKPAFPNSSGLKSVLKKLRLRDG